MNTPQNWVKNHKKAFVNSFIKESGVATDDKPTAIFMAGLPGAGKTELTKKFVEILGGNFLRLDMDEIATKIEGYKPEIADRYREGATLLLNGVFDKVVNKKLDFIMDGTFGHKYAKKNVLRALKHGFNVKIIYVYQDPKLAWEFTLEREKVEHRAINKEKFIETYFTTIDNIKNVLNNKGNSKLVLDIIKKDSYNEVRAWHENVTLEEVDKIIDNHYNKETLKDCLNGR